jgi:hypothetical protein
LGVIAVSPHLRTCFTSDPRANISVGLT